MIVLAPDYSSTYCADRYGYVEQPCHTMLGGDGRAHRLIVVVDKTVALWKLVLT